MTLIPDDAIVVREVKKGDSNMESTAVPDALRVRLGGEGTAGLLDLLDSAQREWTGEVKTLCLDRFERRLVEETVRLRVDIANLRGEMTQMDGKLHAEIAGLRGEMSGKLAHTEGSLRTELAGLRGEMSGQLVQTEGGLRTEIAGLRGEMAQTQGALRVDLVREMQVGFGAIRQELADHRVEFLKWAFVFWVGQFFAVAGLVGVLMQTTLAR